MQANNPITTDRDIQKFVLVVINVNLFVVPLFGRYFKVLKENVCHIFLHNLTAKFYFIVCILQIFIIMDTVVHLVLIFYKFRPYLEASEILSWPKKSIHI